MIFVDTSVWVSFLRGGPPALAREVGRLLDDDDIGLAAIVRIELLGGTSVAQLPVLRRVLDALPTFYPTRDTWQLIEGWVEKAVRAGQRFGAADLLVGALATERGARIWSQDGDFRRMARLGFVKNHRF